VLQCDEVRLFPLGTAPDEARYAQPLSDGEPWDKALALEWVGKRMLPVYVADLAEAGRIETMLDTEAVDATVHVAIAPYEPRPVSGGFRSIAMARVGEPGTPFLYVLEAWSKAPRFFTEERLGILGIVTEHATDLLHTLKKLGMLVMIDELTGMYNRPYFGRQLDHEIARAYREERPMSLVIESSCSGASCGLRGFPRACAILFCRPFAACARAGRVCVHFERGEAVLEAKEICERLRLKVQNLAVAVRGWTDGKPRCA
jgi:hypothetical protein